MTTAQPCRPWDTCLSAIRRRTGAGNGATQEIRTCSSPISAVVLDERVNVITPESPPPAQVTRHVVVAVTRYLPPGSVTEGWV